MNIYVGNLSQAATEADLQEAFGAVGQVSSAKVVTNRFTGEPEGFGFVEMASEAEARKAIASLNGKDLKGQVLVVKEARPPGHARQDSHSGRSNSPQRKGVTEVSVHNDVEKALRILKKKLSEDGDHRRLKERKHFMPRGERKRRKSVRAKRNRRR
jgi:ribosomal protein S21